MKITPRQIQTRIRLLLAVFMVGLVLSGVTAFPLETELRALCSIVGVDPTAPPSDYAGLQHWIALVAEGLRETYAKYPFIAYGTDWLAFAHIVIAIAFIGPYRDPVRNSWVVTFGIIACLGVIPLALIAGAIRQIPFYWRLIDCSFGVLGIIPLMLVRRNTALLESLEQKRESSWQK
jgi:succinate-acetate transporter protein